MRPHVSQILRSLWGVSFSTLPTPAWAARRMGLISCPGYLSHRCLDAGRVLQRLQGESINNGFLNRFLALQSNVRVTDATPVDPVVPDVCAKRCVRSICGQGRQVSCRSTIPRSNTRRTSCHGQTMPLAPSSKTLSAG